MRETQKKDLENMKLKEQIPAEVGKELSKLEMTCRHMGSVLQVLGINVGDGTSHEDIAVKKINFQFQCVTWKLEKALGNFPYDHFDISEEVQEQVELIRAHLRRATERYGGPVKLNLLSQASSQPLDNEIDHLHSGNSGIGTLHIQKYWQY